VERSGRVADEAGSRGYAEQRVHATMVKALALLALERAAEAADAAGLAYEYYRGMGGTQQFEVELHLAAAACMSAAGRVDDADAMRRAAADRLERLLAAISDLAARDRLAADVGRGLPAALRAELRPG
jgi:hypothetical protein